MVAELSRLLLPLLQPGRRGPGGAVLGAHRPAVPRGSSWPLSSYSVVSSVQRPRRPPRRAGAGPLPAADGGLELDPAVVTPSASAGGSLGAKPGGSVLVQRRASRSATPARPSTVVRFQVNATRSRQKLVVANMPRRAGRRRARAGRPRIGEPRVDPVPAGRVASMLGRSTVWSWGSFVGRRLCDPAHTRGARSATGLHELQPGRSRTWCASSPRPMLGASQEEPWRVQCDRAGHRPVPARP